MRFARTDLGRYQAGMLENLSPGWAVAAVVVAILLWQFIPQARAADEPGGFKDVIKNPRQLDVVEDQKKFIEEECKKAVKWTDEQVTEATRAFLFDTITARPWDIDQQILESLGKRTHSPIIKRLEDATLRPKLIKPTGGDPLPQSPFDRACNLLGDDPPKGAVNVFAKFLDDPDEDVRESAAQVLGRIATVEALKPLRKALADSVDDVRDSAIGGIADAANLDAFSFEPSEPPKPLDAAFGREIIGDVEKYFLHTGDYLGAISSVKILLHLDRARAIELFLSDKVFNVKFESLEYALAELAAQKIPVPREKLKGLLAKLEAGDLEDLDSQAFEVLRLLGQQRHADDREFLESRLKASNPKIAAGAATGLLAFHHLEDFKMRIREREARSGLDGLTSAQKQYGAVITFDGEVNNGGLSQYFFNSGGNHWKEALAGLEKMGFNERHKILQSAVATFGKDGPSPDREKRQDQLAKLARKDDVLFDALDKRYYACKEDVDAITAAFVLKNLEAFK